MKEKNFVNQTKIKYDNNRYCVEFPQKLSFDSLEELEKWVIISFKELSEIENWVKVKKYNEYVKKIEEINSKIIFPIYEESCKDVFFEGIRKIVIRNSINSLNKIFDKDSELYEKNEYNVEEILNNIKGSKFINDNLYNFLFDSMQDYYKEKLFELNPDLDPDIIFDLPDYVPDIFYEELIRHITVEELKNVVMENVGTF